MCVDQPERRLLAILRPGGRRWRAGLLQRAPDQLRVLLVERLQCGHRSERSCQRHCDEPGHIAVGSGGGHRLFGVVVNVVSRTVCDANGWMAEIRREIDLTRWAYAKCQVTFTLDPERNEVRVDPIMNLKYR